MTILRYTEIMEHTLHQIGLSEKEAALYLLLLKTPHLTAQQLAESTGIQRTNVYRLLDVLSDQGLIASDNSPVKRFVATEPRALQQLLQKKQDELKQASQSLSRAMPAFRSQYALSLDKPGVVHRAGREGFEQLLDDLATSQTEVLLVASDDYPTDEALFARFETGIMQRKMSGIKTRALFHHCSYEAMIRERFASRGFEVRFVGTTPFRGEVVLYEHNTAFTVYEPWVITTIVTSQHITDTMRTLFEEVWKQAAC